MSDVLARLPRAYRSQTLPPTDGESSAADRQERVEGWDQARVSEAEIDVIGGGGIGSQVALYLAKIGIGTLRICEPDIVEASNTNRQLFGPSDLGRFKAHVLARRVAELSALPTSVIGYPLYFCDYEEQFGAAVKPRLVASGVDNNRARRQVEEWSRKVGVPHVAVGIARDSGSAYVFVSEPGRACLGCYLGAALTDKRKNPCAGTAAVLDVLQAICGFANYAITSLVMKRKRTWNLVQAFMEGGTAKPSRIEKRANCPVCGGT